jgi:ribosomal-protein-alanine N-acetyltransferase
MARKEWSDGLKVEVVEMGEKHLPEVIQIESDSFSTPWSPSIFQRVLRDDKTRSIVALAMERVVGYAIFWVIGDFAELGDFAVRKEYRGKGIGDVLLEGVIDICKVLSIKSLFLEVRESNSAAQGLYLKKGFAEIMRRQSYYSDPVEDAIVFGLDIEDKKDLR